MEGFFQIYIPLILSLSVHECAHAYAALKLGDDTAKLLGRVSLNPFVHLDIVGTVILPLLGIPIGWAKPVPFNPNRFHLSISHKLGAMIVALAGPISNLVLAIIFAILLHFLNAPSISKIPPIAVLISFSSLMIGLNVTLAIFNLIPVPPLDGSHILTGLAPTWFDPIMNLMQKYSPFFLILVIYFSGYLIFDLQSFFIHVLTK